MIYTVVISEVLKFPIIRWEQVTLQNKKRELYVLALSTLRIYGAAAADVLIKKPKHS